ncbi:BMP family ABC transporter substrate-binding protein [Alteribacter populi]|uniref:BMP family ABC transporter substrate-binding protein n=1 Tax=Alteribacter populi TaxID=2011011 RepID=UPI000BBB4A46|nr:BMP family ABC transporter substrate-binding protein [Alteribacter populi]
MKLLQGVLVLVLASMLTGCVIAADSGDLKKAGLLLPHPMDDQGWNKKGYEGMLTIHSNMEVDVLLEENIRSYQAIYDAVEAFDEEGVNLVFGHSQIYAKPFMTLKDDYPHIHFVSFNGEVDGENITSLHFQGYSMGFFAGMLASEMSESDEVAVIAAFPWQPEVEGFEDGAKHQMENVTVHVDYVESWADEEKALSIYQTMKRKGVDVYYPAGDGYHVSVIEEVKDDGFHAIGYVGDQQDLGESTILTSTVQRVDQLYENVASQFNEGSLESGNRYYDFQDGVVTLGEYSVDVPESLQKWLDEQVEVYIETGKLPSEIEDSME